MIRFLVAIATFSALVSGAFADLSSEVIDYLIRDPFRAELHVVTPEIREKVILYLRRSALGQDPKDGLKTGHGPDSNAQLLLLRLGHDQTIQEAVQSIRVLAEKKRMLISTGFDDIVGSAQPLLIPYFAEYLPREDGNSAWVQRDDDLTFDWFPVSAAGALYMVRIMEKSAAFTPAVTEWAKKTRHEMRLRDTHNLRSYRTRDIVGFREMMREWWRENAAFFEARNYQAVQPGRLLVQEEASAPEAVPVASAAAPSASPPISPAPTTAVPVAIISESPGPSGASLWTGAAIAFAVLTGLLIFWKRRA